MKKIIHLSLMAFTIICTFTTAATMTYASTNNVEHLARGPIWGPDGEWLGPGIPPGDPIAPSPIFRTILHDPFINFGSSIFRPANHDWGRVTMTNGVLTLNEQSTVFTDKPIELKNNTTYRITLGNLNNLVLFTISADGSSGYSTIRIGSTSDESFLYTHQTDQPAYFYLTGFNASLNFLTIEEQIR